MHADTVGLEHREAGMGGACAGPGAQQIPGPHGGHPNPASKI